MERTENRLPQAACENEAPPNEVRFYTQVSYSGPALNSHEMDAELRSANPNYGPIIVEKEYAESKDWFKVIGKVVRTVNIGKPKSAF